MNEPTHTRTEHPWHCLMKAGSRAGESNIEGVLAELESGMPGLIASVDAEFRPAIESYFALVRRAVREGNPDVLHEAKWSGDGPCWLLSMAAPDCGGTVLLRDRWNPMVDELRFALRRRQTHAHPVR